MWQQITATLSFRTKFDNWTQSLCPLLRSRSWCYVTSLRKILGLVESAKTLSILSRHGGDDLSAVTLPATMSIQLVSLFQSLVLKEQEGDFVPNGKVREMRGGQCRLGIARGCHSGGNARQAKNK